MTLYCRRDSGKIINLKAYFNLFNFECFFNSVRRPLSTVEIHHQTVLISMPSILKITYCTYIIIQLHTYLRGYEPVSFEITCQLDLRVTVDNQSCCESRYQLHIVKQVPSVAVWSRIGNHWLTH